VKWKDVGDGYDCLVPGSKDLERLYKTVCEKGNTCIKKKADFIFFGVKEYREDRITEGNLKGKQKEI